MIIHIWLSTLMHFMHAAQMIFLLNVYMLITESSFYSLTMYKRKTQKTNSIDVNIFDESKFKTNLKWRKILKSFVTVDSLKQLKRLYNSFLISKFSEMSRDSRMISKWLQKMLFNAKLSFQERNLLIEMLYKRKTVLIWNFSEIDKVRLKIMKDQKIRIISHKI